MTSPPSPHPQTQSDRDAGLTAADYQDLASCITALIEAARQAGREDSLPITASEIPVNAALQRLYDRLARHGLDGTGWMPEPPTRDEFLEIEQERDRALAEVDTLQATVLDLHHRLAYERERADRAEAHERVAQGWSAGWTA